MLGRFCSWASGVFCREVVGWSCWEVAGWLCGWSCCWFGGWRLGWFGGPELGWFCREWLGWFRGWAPEWTSDWSRRRGWSCRFSVSAWAVTIVVRGSRSGRQRRGGTFRHTALHPGFVCAGPEGCLPGRGPRSLGASGQDFRGGIAWAERLGVHPGVGSSGVGFPPGVGVRDGHRPVDSNPCPDRCRHPVPRCPPTCGTQVRVI